MNARQHDSIRKSAALVFCCLAVSLSPVFAAETSKKADIPSLSPHPQLFLDDVMVARKKNLKRVIQHPKRHPQNPLIVQDQPWEKRMISVYGTVQFDPSSKKYRCWYAVSEADNGVPDTPEAPGTAEYYQCYAESTDGIHWTKPPVGQKQYGRHRRHNIVIPDAHGLCVLKLPNHPEIQKRYVGVGGATLTFSPDGIHWKRSKAPFTNWAEAVRKNDTSSCIVRWKDEYLAFVRFQGKDNEVLDPKTGISWRGTMRQVGIMVSQDLMEWTPKKMVFTTDDKDNYPWTQVYGMPVTPYGDVLIGLIPLLRLKPQKGNNGYGTTETQMVVSRDGRHWSRVADRAVFLRSLVTEEDFAKRRWDMEVYPSTTMLLKDDQIHIYYTGKNIIHGERRLEGKKNLKARFGIGLATLPADRFVALRRQDNAKPGMLETRPMSLSATNLLVNADIDSDDLQVEVLDQQGRVIPGFEGKRSQLTRRDKLRYRVTWNSGDQQQTLKALGNNPVVALRFILKRGDLFAFQVVD